MTNLLIKKHKSHSKIDDFYLNKTLPHVFNYATKSIILKSKIIYLFPTNPKYV